MSINDEGASSVIELDAYSSYRNGLEAEFINDNAKFGLWTL